MPWPTWCGPDLFTRTDGQQSAIIVHKTLFLSFSTTLLLDLQLTLLLLSVVSVVSVHKNCFILPCLRVTGLSGQADANL